MFVLDRSKTATIAAPEPEAMPIARELSRCLGQALGQSYGIVGAEDVATGTRIALNVRPALAGPLPGQGEVIAWRCDGKARLELSGSNVHALWLSVYAFLREYVGCRWFLPGELGEDIPSLKQVRVGRLDEARRPSFATRDWRRWPIAFQRQMLASEHNMGSAHAYGAIVPAELAREHPEYTCMLNGRRRGAPPYQICTSQPGVEDRAVEYCLEYFREHPDAPMVSMCPNDTNMFCDCPECVATNLGVNPAEAGDAKPPHWVSRSVFEFTNRVAERVSEVHPDKLLVVIAYGRTELPPADLKLHDNVLVWYCTWTFRAVCPSGKRKMRGEIAGWSRIGRQLGIYEYLVNQSWPGLPRPMPTQVARNMKHWHRKKVRHYYTQHASDFGMSLPNYYVAAMLAWDVKQDPAAMLDEFYRRCFGKAGPAIRAYYEIFEKAVMSEARRDGGPGSLGVTGHERTHEQIPIIYRPEVLADADAAIRKATQAADDDVTAGRVKVVAEGLNLLKAAVAASRRTYDFENAFYVPTLSIRPWHIGNYDYASAVEKLHLYGERCVDEVKALITVWREYDELRRRLSETLTVDERWSRGASFNPLPRLEKIDELYQEQAERSVVHHGGETRVA